MKEWKKNCNIYIYIYIKYLEYYNKEFIIFFIINFKNY